MKQLDETYYAHTVETEEGLELRIGRDVPNNPSHGAANGVGFFNTAEDARQYAINRGVPANRIHAA